MTPTSRNSPVNENDKINALCNGLVDDRNKHPDTYFVVGSKSMKGERRERMARLFGVYKRDMKAAELDSALIELNLNNKK